MSADRRPWWQTANTARQGFVLGTFWLVLAVAQGVVAVGGSRWWSWLLAIGCAVLGLAYLVPAELMRRRSPR